MFSTYAYTYTQIYHSFLRDNIQSEPKIITLCPKETTLGKYQKKIDDKFILIIQLYVPQH